MKKLFIIPLSVLPFLLLWLYLAWEQSTNWFSPVSAHTFGDSFYLITLILLAMAVAIAFIVTVEKCCKKKDKE